MVLWWFLAGICWARSTDAAVGSMSISLSVLSVTNSNAVVPSGLFFPLCLQNNSFQDCFSVLLFYFTFSKITAELLQLSNRKVANMARLVSRGYLSVGCIIMTF